MLEQRHIVGHVVFAWSLDMFATGGEYMSWLGWIVDWVGWRQKGNRVSDVN
jgi:hypothetical protein